MAYMEALKQYILGSEGCLDFNINRASQGAAPSAPRRRLVWATSPFLHSPVWLDGTPGDQSRITTNRNTRFGRYSQDVTQSLACVDGVHYNEATVGVRGTVANMLSHVLFNVMFPSCVPGISKFSG